MNTIRTKLLCMFIIVALIATATMTAVGQATTTKLYVDPWYVIDLALEPASVFSVDIDVADVIDLYGFEFKLLYDPSVLTATNVVVGDFLPDSFQWWKEINDVEGYVWYSITRSLGATEGVDGSGTLAIITFSVDAYGESTLEFDPTIHIFTDRNGLSILHEVENGYFSNIADVEEIYMADIARRSAWPERHHYSVSKDAPPSGDGLFSLYAKVKNKGTRPTTVKVVFSIYNSGLAPVDIVETAEVHLFIGEIRNLSFDWDGFVEGKKYHVEAQCRYDSDGDDGIDSAGTKLKQFSFSVVA